VVVSVKKGLETRGNRDDFSKSTTGREGKTNRRRGTERRRDPEKQLMVVSTNDFGRRGKEQSKEKENKKNYSFSSRRLPGLFAICKKKGEKRESTKKKKEGEGKDRCTPPESGTNWGKTSKGPSIAADFSSSGEKRGVRRRSWGKGGDRKRGNFASE